MAALSSMYKQIRLYCRSVPELTMDFAIRLAAEEFCRKSWYVRETIEVDEELGVQFYDMESSTPDETKILGVVAVQRGEDQPLYPTTQETVQQFNSYVDGFIFLPPSTLEEVEFLPADGDVDDIETLYVRVALTVTEDCTVIPDALVQQYRQNLAFGAIHNLANMPGEAWSNDKLAAESATKFYEGVYHAKSNAIFGHKPWGNQIALRRFAI